MDQPFPMPVNSDQPTTMVNPTVKNSNKFFFVALIAIIIGAAAIVGIFLLAFPSPSQEEVTTSTSNDINSVSGLDKANSELDSADFTTLENDLQANDTDSANF